MIQLQDELTLLRAHLQECLDTLAKAQTYQAESSLLADIFSRNGRENQVRIATPPGYGYEQETSLSPLDVDPSGPVMQIAAHPGDGPDFFYATYLKVASNTHYRNSFHEVLLTDGEGGVDGWHPERTRQVRMKEAYAGAQVVESNLHFLRYPDGGLSSLAPGTKARLIAQLAQEIEAIQPSIVVVHPPKNDHPDHAQSFLLTIAALGMYTRAGGKAPTLLIHDVEFGLQQRSIWASPACDLLAEAYPVHVPEFIVDISSTHSLAQQALWKHQTQMYDPVLGQPKLYVDLIDSLAQVRGLQFEENADRIPMGQGFSHVVLPGVTSEYNLLPLRLPPNSIYRRVKKAA
ncbi:PIG-L deacetylase family protein [Ktedonospora formicarum]|uniref:PIG-L family deacetylase n=1 Tax=Ktedonospora formicarum TaxID=2778364 RepID=A0A8J3I916_9CHLR|nr:PIG-L family deacetylase [Ktedonospora formicarum]GHO48003.1 hypothetical protein KSX_61660 [Ktedonospora formicarum]